MLLRPKASLRATAALVFEWVPLESILNLVGGQQ